MNIAIVFLCLFLSSSLSYSTEKKVGFLKDPLDFQSNNDYDQGWFTNTLDHINQADNRTYDQRFWISTEEFDELAGPIFVYICGEYTCSVPYERDFPHQLAQKHNGLFLVLEHRYYGDSQPFDDWTTESLKYLSIEQALADTAVFLDTFNLMLQEKYGGERRQVVVVGGSYPGAFSAWMRYKYPHIVDASISSSGVVKAILDYDMYDYQIFNSTSRSGPCSGVILNMTIAIDTFIKYNNTEELNRVKSIFNASSLDTNTFAEFFADQFAGQVQYGSRTKMCAALNQSAYADVWYQFNTTRDYFGTIEDIDSYTIDYLKNTTIDINKNMRQWTYQTCTEVAYFQTVYSKSPTRASVVNLDYYKDICYKAFGVGIWPNVNHTNTLLGDTHLTRTNIFFTNGYEDPWKWAGAMSVPEYSGMEAQVVDCEDCAHCVELYTPKDTDAPVLKQARKRIETWLENILKSDEEKEIKLIIKQLIE